MGTIEQHIVTMSIEYDSDASSDEVQAQVKAPAKPLAAPSLEDEEAFPDFGEGASAPTAAAPNFMAAWSSSKAPQKMPEPVSKPKRKAVTTEAAQPAASVVQQAPAAAVSTGAGVPWSEGAWSMNAAKENQVTWLNKRNLNIDQAFKSAGKYKDPAALATTSSSTAPKKKKQEVAKAAPSASQPKVEEQATAAPPKKERPQKKITKDDDGFTEVVSHKREERKDKPEETGGKVLGVKSAFDALDDNEDVEKENSAPGKKKNRKQQKQEKKEKEEVVEDVKVITAPKKKKKGKAKEEDFDAVMAEDKASQKEGSKKGKKKGNDEQQAGGLPLGIVGAALVGVAGLLFYFSQQAPVVAK